MSRSINTVTFANGACEGEILERRILGQAQNSSVNSFYYSIIIGLPLISLESLLQPLGRRGRLPAGVVLANVNCGLIFDGGLPF